MKTSRARRSSKDWTLEPNTPGLISLLLRKFSYIVPLRRRQRYQNSEAFAIINIFANCWLLCVHLFVRATVDTLLASFSGPFPPQFLILNCNDIFCWIGRSSWRFGLSSLKWLLLCIWCFCLSNPFGSVLQGMYPHFSEPSKPWPPERFEYVGNRVVRLRNSLPNQTPTFFCAT